MRDSIVNEIFKKLYEDKLFKKMDTEENFNFSGIYYRLKKQTKNNFNSSTEKHLGAHIIKTVNIQLNSVHCRIIDLFDGILLCCETKNYLCMCILLRQIFETIAYETYMMDKFENKINELEDSKGWTKEKHSITHKFLDEWVFLHTKVKDDYGHIKEMSETQIRKYRETNKSIMNAIRWFYKILEDQGVTRTKLSYDLLSLMVHPNPESTIYLYFLKDDPNRLKSKFIFKKNTFVAFRDIVFLIDNFTINKLNFIERIKVPLNSYDKKGFERSLN